MAWGVGEATGREKVKLEGQEELVGKCYFSTVAWKEKFIKKQVAEIPSPWLERQKELFWIVLHYYIMHI